MNGREIPGFYFDPEKKKYFKVLPNHVAPEGAKYSRDNVKKEKEQSKKRKRSLAFKQKKEAQTVHRSRILQNPLVTGISLNREHGASHFRSYEARTAALARQYVSSELISLKGCESCGRRELVYDFDVDADTGSILWGLGSQHFGRLQYLTCTSNTHDLASFKSNISSVAITNNRTIVTTSFSSHYPGNVFIAGLSETSGGHGTMPILDSPAPCFLTLGDETTDLWTAAPNPPGSTDLIAIGGSKQTYLVSSDANLIHTYDVGNEIRAIDWLTPNVAMGGTKRRPILLWDARTGGSSIRFQHNSGVTAIKSLDNGSQMVVAGFDGMAIYDVRMPYRTSSRGSRAGNNRDDNSSNSSGMHTSAPLLQMPFRTERPTTAMAVNPKTNILAIANDANIIQLHSLLSGKLVGELGTPDTSKHPESIRRLKFIEGNLFGRPSLMACKGSVLTQWTWGGVDSEDEG